MNFNKEALTRRLNTLVKENNLAGVSACILGPDHFRYDFSAGFIDAAETKAPDSDTMFGIASMSKSITALCTCLLALEGKLSLEDPVCAYFPSFRVPELPREAVTVRHLAMHTAGIPPMEPLEWSIVMNTPGRDDSEYSIRLRENSPGKMDTIEEIIDYIAACPYPSTGMPGQNLSYSNEGYAILSYIVDKAAGEPLERYMHERIFAPLGMTRSILDNGHLAAQALSGGNMTSLFELNDGKRTCDDNWSVLPPFRGCAMVKSTARDMAVYYQTLSNYGMLDGVQVLPREAIEMLLGNAHPVSPYLTMCMGINKRAYRGHVLCEHAGGLHGVSTKGGLLLGEGFGMSVLCNQGDEDMDPLLWSMYNAILGLPLEESHEWYMPVSYPFSDFEMLYGAYISHEGIPSVFTLTPGPNGPEAVCDDTRLSLVYCGGTRFKALRENGTLNSRMEFLITDGKAWGVRRGTRIFGRIPE